MRLSSLHILLTYQCTYECDHCFVWGSPRQTGVLTISSLEKILGQARDAGVKSVYFEGGEPFLYYPILVSGVRKASELGLSVGIVSNAYWATSVQDAAEWLRPLAGRIENLTVSSDLFHCDRPFGEAPQNALAAAKLLGVGTGVISIDQPGDGAPQPFGQLDGESAVMYRGRAARSLALERMEQPWHTLEACPFEDLRDPGRVHVDPFGNVHLCQGLLIGNIFSSTLKEVCDSYDPETHPVCHLLLHGGPAALVSEYGLPHRQAYADACHLCYEARVKLRPRLGQLLGPDQVYGVDL
jgi:MoaA/NifB/PqqE/SkfB family radical SAM enzyme